VSRYRARLSGPLLDRLDLHVDVPALTFAEIHGAKRGESSAAVRERVIAARAIQQDRQGCPNAAIHPAELRRLVKLETSASALLQGAVDRLGLSGRAHDRVLQVGLTIRDLSRPSVQVPVVLGTDEIAEALAYRRLDRRVAQVVAPGAS
jgi:magnesium chelatase family protein